MRDDGEPEPDEPPQGLGLRWYAILLRPRPARDRYLLALLLLAASIGLTWVVQRLDPSRGFQALTSAVTVLAAMLLGRGPALVVAVLGALSAEVLLIEPLGQIVVSLSSVGRVIIYVALAVLVAELVTTLKRALEVVDHQRRAAERLARAQRTVLNVVSHDLRTPLLGVRVQAQILERLHERAPNPAVAEAALRIRSGTDRMQRIVSDLRDAVRLELGNLPLDPRDRDVAEVMDEALAPLRAEAEARGVRFVQHVAQRPLLACVDRLDQVLANLVENALRATPDGGTVEVSAQPDGPCVRLEVRDTGRGIAPDDLPHLFDRFWTRSDQGVSGTGLGLFIVRGILEGQRGTIDVRSELGSGTTFVVRVRASAARHPQPRPEEDARP